MLGELLESPGEQQTEIAWRHFVRDQPEDQKMRFYRIDTVLKEDIPLDGVGSIDRLHEYGKLLAEQIDWRLSSRAPTKSSGSITTSRSSRNTQ
jgi:hypothetical protein